jgi:hypothetical protein
MIAAFPMTFDEFQALARLYVVGGLDDDEQASFEHGREEFGARAESYLAECERLASAFALSLDPKPLAPDAREDLLARIRATAPQPPKRRWFH